MNTLRRYRDWPIRWKVGLLLLGTSLLPLAVTAFIEYRSEREELIKGATALLAARGDQVVEQLDDFHRAYQKSASRLSQLPEVERYSAASPIERGKLMLSVRPLLEMWQASDPNFRGVGILDPSGTVAISTEKPLENKNLGFHSYVQEALRGSQVISDLHISSAEVGSVPTIAYLSPVKTSGGKVLAVLAMWVKASAMWKILESANEKAGPGSFSVLFDRFGVRIGHSYSKDIIYHPGGSLDSQTMDIMIAERRFGDNTRALLTDPKSFPDQFDRARSHSVNRDLFRGFAPVNQQWNYGVPRRLEATPWTLFYMVPEHWLLIPVKDTLKRLLAVAGVAIIIALSIGMLIGRGLVGPISALSETAESLSRGNLDRRVVLNASDELGRLGTSFNTMAERLEVMIESERRTSENLQKTVSEYADFANKIGGGDLTVRLNADSSSMTGQLGVALNNMVTKQCELAAQTKETATILINTAVEISTVTTQVASAAAQAATAVNETTTTVEEVKQTAQVASQKAKNVLDSAQKAAHVSEAGKKSVGDSVEGMNRIREQMDLISESIVKLSEQSQAIGEIIATVNDLTDQSNLLAVNAAIEAAKAGEQGKGFAVVAQEIKSLAEQSKQATTQVKNILSDIQKATGSAVMATEQGSKVVESGMSQSTKAGEAIRALADSIVEAAQAATQIAASSQQQLVGTDQVALAMENIKQASTQNVAGTKQAETAAHNLHALGQKLKQLVEQYRV